MRPFEVYYKWHAEGVLLLLGYTATGEAIVVDVDGAITTTDEELVVAFPSPDWPITFIDQLTYRRKERVPS